MPPRNGGSTRPTVTGLSRDIRELAVAVGKLERAMERFNDANALYRLSQLEDAIRDEAKARIKGDDEQDSRWMWFYRVGVFGVIFMLVGALIANWLIH